MKVENKAIKFDKMVREREDDELGLFEKYDEILSEIRNKITNFKAKKVLDIGCGTGNLCGDLSDDIYILGLDQSLEMISLAKKKYANMDFKIGSFLDKPFVEHDFEIVVTTYAFHSLNDEEKKEAINNMLGFLKDNGKIIIVDFMFKNDLEKEESKKELLGKKRKDLWEVIDYKYYTNVEEFKKYIQDLGYKFKCEHKVNFTWIVEIEKK
ncbi:class I SAM-dependent methyltransferase [Clostridium sp. YIM B02551]|uniref:class I SAM-dependent methyltransferase n=1 Tax=Clostridium sp. YIM B02551 TaxID=2910679 RepID=UPI001EEA7831|nr:class I SAM-dependent methyltransferase [Clostridium sp. YIM B02551]